MIKRVFLLLALLVVQANAEGAEYLLAGLARGEP